METIKKADTGLEKFSNFSVVALTMMMGALIGLFIIQISPALAVIFLLSIGAIIIWQTRTTNKKERQGFRKAIKG